MTRTPFDFPEISILAALTSVGIRDLGVPDRNRRKLAGPTEAGIERVRQAEEKRAKRIARNLRLAARPQPGGRDE